MFPNRNLRPSLAALVVSLGLGAPMPAQLLPVRSAAATGSPSGSEVVELSPFVVSTDKDVGYQAGNTTSGSRLNTSLKDTAAAVLVFTPEFLADFGANSLADIVGYAPNMMVDNDDAGADVSTAFLGGSNFREIRIRVRGLAASTSLDFFETGIPMDNYNTERIELSGGPNSILFGFGSPGGLVNTMSKRAQLNRTRTSLCAQGGEWALQRYEFDHNQVLFGRRLAVRVNALRESSGGWRRWDFNDLDRAALSLRALPWTGGGFTVNYENGRMKSHVSRPLNAYDSVALWLARGSVTKSDAAWTAADRALGINRQTATRVTYVTSDLGAPPFVLTTSNAVNFRQLESTFDDFNVPVADRAGQTQVPASQIPYRYSTYGPGASRDLEFDRVLATFEQRIARDLTIELAYNREDSKQGVKAPNFNNFVLAGDPNTLIPDPRGSAAPVPNPHRGALFLETRWDIDEGLRNQEVFRGSVAWEANWGRFGKHKIAGMAERAEVRAARYPGNEILVDANGVPINNAVLPENAANFVWRRHYVVPGDYDTYVGGNGEAPFTVTRDGRTYHNTFIYRTAVGGNILRTMNTLLLATQSSFFESRLILTAGVRRDRIDFDTYGSTRLSAADPDVRAGRAIQNTVRFSSEITDRTRFEPVTSTLGGVYHASRLLSVFYNHSDNNSQPSLSARILPDERLAPPVDGITDDGGFMLNLMEGKIFLRATVFRTSQEKSSGSPFSIGLDRGEYNLAAVSTRILDTLLAANRITPAEYSDHRVAEASNLVGQYDMVNRGGELSAWFNVSRNVTGLVNLSYTQVDRSGIIPEFEGWFARESAFWRRAPGSGALVSAESGLSVDAEAAEIQRLVSEARDYFSFPFGERPYKANASGRYTFTEGTLKGLFAGGGIRWQSQPKLGRALLGRLPNGSRRFGETYEGPESFMVDAFAGYRSKLTRLPRSPEFTVQLNLSNLTGEDDVMPLRYNALKSGYSRVLLPEPRRFRLTFGLSF